MKQRARLAGVLANPFRFIEAGQEFEHAELMNWAVPVEEPPADEAAEPEQDAQVPVPDPKPTKEKPKGVRKQPAAEPEPEQDPAPADPI